jgi:GNAT superfamily N-acetyltransferase
MRMSYQLRPATPADQPVLAELIARSIRKLGAGYYSAAQIEAALQGAFGIDTSLIEDGTYFVAEDGRGAAIACGGWGRRRTLFGASTLEARDDSWLDPRTEAARIRAFFVDPAHARRGLGRLILARSEAQATRAGFRSFELMATLPGVPFYRECGYEPGTPLDYPLPGGLHISFVPMSKRVTMPHPV